jgi:hypothetical protein
MESNNMIPYGYGSKPWQLMHPKIASKWMFIPLKLIIIGFGPIPYVNMLNYWIDVLENIEADPL